MNVLKRFARRLAKTAWRWGYRPYGCFACWREHRKLWRRYNAFLDYQELLCADCALQVETDARGPVDADGMSPCEYFPARPSCQIGSLIPAVPDGTGTFWGYCAVPPELAKWWRGLPS